MKYNLFFPYVCIKHCQSYWLNKYLPSYESWIGNRGSSSLTVMHGRDLCVGIKTRHTIIPKAT